jgi:hypothetical protein
MAFKAAVEKAIVEHARQGLLMFIWREGKIVELSPEEVRAEAARPQAERPGKDLILHDPVIGGLSSKPRNKISPFSNQCVGNIMTS